MPGLPTPAFGGGAFPDLSGGNPGGGFGGGGGGFQGGGGGGGYSGGAGAVGGSGGGLGGAGGGGLSDEGTDAIVVGDIWPGNGKVVITIVAPVFEGTPGKSNCHGQSVSSLAQQFGGLDGAAAALGYANVNALQEAIQEFCHSSPGA